MKSLEKLDDATIIERIKILSALPEDTKVLTVPGDELLAAYDELRRRRVRARQDSFAQRSYDRLTHATEALIRRVNEAAPELRNGDIPSCRPRFACDLKTRAAKEREYARYPWEELGTTSRMWGVFSLDDECAMPFMIGRKRAWLVQWIEDDKARGDESVIGGLEVSVLALDEVTGFLWNENTDPPSEPRG